MFFNDRSSAPKAVSLAKKHANLTVLAADGGIVGTVDRSWDSAHPDGNPAYAIAVSKDVMSGRTAAPVDQCKWLLGDFKAFGQLLANQLASRDIEQEVSDAL